MSVQHRQSASGPIDMADARQKLEAQLALTQHYIDTARHADQAMLEGDVQVTPAVIALENQRNPGLQLTIAPSPSALLQRIKAMPPVFQLRCVIRSSENSINGAHHLFADIKREAGGLLSILIIEPAHLRNNQNGRSMLLALLILMMPDPTFSGRRMSCFNVGAQMSGSDCLIFCVDFALKAHRYEPQLAALHAIHFSGHAIGNEPPDPAIDQNNADTLSVAPARMLPFLFFEHAQSATLLQETFDSDDPRVAEQIRKMHRQPAQSSDADAAGHGKFEPSSIELLRRRFLLDTLAALAGPDDRQQ